MESGCNTLIAHLDQMTRSHSLAGWIHFYIIWKNNIRTNFYFFFQKKNQSKISEKNTQIYNFVYNKIITWIFLLLNTSNLSLVCHNRQVVFSYFQNQILDREKSNQNLTFVFTWKNKNQLQLEPPIMIIFVVKNIILYSISAFNIPLKIISRCKQVEKKSKWKTEEKIWWYLSYRVD